MRYDVYAMPAQKFHAGADLISDSDMQTLAAGVDGERAAALRGQWEAKGYVVRVVPS